MQEMMALPRPEGPISNPRFIEFKRLEGDFKLAGGVSLSVCSYVPEAVASSRSSSGALTG